MIEPKYIQQLKPGDCVQYMQKLHTVQQFRNRLFIQYTNEAGERKRLYMENHPDYLFPYGSYADWVINEWWKIYPEYGVFKSFAEQELLQYLAA